MSQKQASTSGTFYAVIGGKSPGVQNTRRVPLLSLSAPSSFPTFFPSPFLPGGKRQPSWPITFKCSTRQAADVIADAHSLINDNIGFDIDIADQARLIWQSKVIRNYESTNLKGPYYPVVYTGFSGSESIVYSDWHTDAAPALCGSTKPIFRRVELFHEALVYMILRGDKALLADYNFTSKEPSSQPPWQLTPPQPAYRTVISPTTPSTPSRKFNNETTSHYRFTSPPPSSHRAEKSPLPNASQDVEKVWSNVRTLRGIVASYSQPQPFLEDPPPSFNPLADRYFETHGYQAATLFNIGRIFAESSGDSDAFVQCLAGRGTAWTEAEWIWEILNNP